uniref:Uncharacterized protein n=1 Tax=Triticum urartu TaxID=4572 RepID=A0A8R7UJ95_TRIUA
MSEEYTNCTNNLGRFKLQSDNSKACRHDVYQDDFENTRQRIGWSGQRRPGNMIGRPGP